MTRVKPRVRELDAWCPYCEQWLPHADFKPRSHGKFYRYCRTCVRAKKYGLSRDGLIQMYVDQDNCCAACSREFNNDSCIDHDHSCCDGDFSCGECVRGVICKACNTAAGVVGDSPERLELLANYIRYGVTYSIS